MNVTVLIENTTEGKYKCEHGLSLYIEYKDKKILLDAGQSSMFMGNAELLGIDINDVDFCVMSHAHYDHSGGFGFYRNINSRDIYMMNDAWGEYCSMSTGKLRKIGFPIETRIRCENYAVKIDEVTKLSEDIYLVPTEKTRFQAQRGKETKLYKRVGKDLEYDDFTHEMSLVFKTDKGLVIFNSCSHSGIDLIIPSCIKATGEERIKAYIGGLHLNVKENGIDKCRLNNREMGDLCRRIRQWQIEKVYTGHCTGDPAYEKMNSLLGERLNKLCTGLRFTI